MSETKEVGLVPYDLLSPGYEAVYTGEKVAPGETRAHNDGLYRFEADAAGRVFKPWSPWTWTWAPGMHDSEPQWDDQIRSINSLQASLGPLSDSTRRIRAHIGTLVPCDMGFPVTVDQLLSEIGTGQLATKPFHNGCWVQDAVPNQGTTQPQNARAWKTIETVLSNYMEGVSRENVLKEFPYAEGFILRTYDWLGPVEGLSRIQKLALEYMLLPLPIFTCADTPSLSERQALIDRVFVGNIRNGRGAEIRKEIAEAAGLPKLTDDLIESIQDELTQNVVRVVWHNIGDMYHEGCDCHHSAFRWTEAWIHGIATGSPFPPTRRKGAERERMGHALFGYVLGLDRWLQEIPMQFLLLDLGHVDLGFDPRNEILRVYAHLGEKTPTKTWLAACLWYNLTYNSIFGNPGGLVRHPGLLKLADEKGIDLRGWMEARLEAAGTQA